MYPSTFTLVLKSLPPQVDKVLELVLFGEVGLRCAAVCPWVGFGMQFDFRFGLEKWFLKKITAYISMA
jgi:hypothetical protein